MTNLKLIIFLTILCFQYSLGYRKAIATFYPPPIQPHPTTRHAWACNKIINQNGGFGTLDCDRAGIYFIFSTEAEEINGNYYELPLSYIGRSTIDVRNRISDHYRLNNFPIQYIVCYMEFPAMNNEGYSNRVTPVEQALLHQFKTQFNSWDNLGFDSQFDTAYADPNGMGWDILASFYNMNINMPSMSIIKRMGHEWDGDYQPFTQHFVKSSKENDNTLADVFSEGIPFSNGMVAKRENDFCNRTEEDYKPHSNGYYLSIADKLKQLNKIPNKNDGSGQPSAARIAAVDAAVAGGAIAGGIAAGAAGVSEGAVIGFFSRVGSLASRLASRAASRGGNFVRDSARQYAQDWRNAGQEIGNYAEEGYNAWREGTQEIGNGARNYAEEGYNAWREGTQEIGNGIRQSAREVGNGIRQSPREVVNGIRQSAGEAYEIIKDGADEIIIKH